VDKDHPISLNPLSIPIKKSAIANEFMESVNTAVNALNPGQQEITVLMAKIIRNALRVFTPEQMNIKHLGDFLEFDYLRTKIPDPYWSNFDRMKGNFYINKEQVESAKRISARLSLFYEDENMLPFVEGENQFDIPAIARDKKVYVFNLYGLDDEITAFIGCLITHQLKSYYLHQAKKDSPPLYFYCDEYHLFMSSLFKRFLAEARKYNISINLAGHSFSQVSKELASMILGNCHVIVSLKANMDDLKIIADHFNIKKDNFLKLDKYEAIIIIGKDVHKILCYPPPNITPYNPQPIPQVKADVYQWLKSGWIMV
jgi:hypothetical protein